MNYDYRTERYVLQMTWEQLPAEVQARALVCSVDLMTALILGVHGEQFQNGKRLARHMQAGELSIPGDTDRYGFLGAVTALAHASNSFDIDDGHNRIKGHPGTSFVGGVLAAGLERDISYREYLTTLVVAYDVAVRMGLALQDHYGFLHSTGAYGAVATAAGIGRIFGFDVEQMNTAISMAEFHAPMVPVMRAVEVPSMNKDGVPFGGMVGALAALDTLAGETAKTHLLELPQYAPLTDTLGSRYEILQLYFKPYTCCRWGHQPIAAVIEMMREHGVTDADVEAVTVHTFAAATRLSKIVPQDTDEAQYNIAYPVAAAIVHGDVGYRQVCNAALGDERVIRMMQRLRFEEDEQMEREFPEKRLAWVELMLKSGTRLVSRVYAADGEASDGVDMAWMEKKFRRVTSPFLDESAAQDVLTLLTTELDRPLRDVVAGVNRALGMP